MTVVGHIHIEIAYIAENHRITVVGNPVDHLLIPRNCVPAIHTCRLTLQLPVRLFGMSQSHFLPTAELQTVLLHDVRHLCNEILGQIMRLRHPLLFHQRHALG